MIKTETKLIITLIICSTILLTIGMVLGASIYLNSNPYLIKFDMDDNTLQALGIASTNSNRNYCTQEVALEEYQDCIAYSGTEEENGIFLTPYNCQTIFEYAELKGEIEKQMNHNDRRR